MGFDLTMLLGHFVCMPGRTHRDLTECKVDRQCNLMLAQDHRPSWSYSRTCGALRSSSSSWTILPQTHMGPLHHSCRSQSHSKWVTEHAKPGKLNCNQLQMQKQPSTSISAVLYSQRIPPDCVAVYKCQQYQNTSIGMFLALLLPYLLQI